MKNVVMVLLAVSLAAGTLFAVDVAEQPRDVKKLISLDFNDTSLSTVLDVLSLKTGRKFITDSELARKRIILTLKDVTPDEALSALLDTYNLYYVRQGETDIYVIKNKTDEVKTTVTKVFFLNYLTAKDAVQSISSNVSKAGVINANDASNSIIATDVTDNLDKIEALLRMLDIPPLQVLLEARIIDVKLDSGFKAGTNITSLYRTGNLWQNPLSPTAALKPQVGYSQLLAPGLAGAGGQMNVNVISGDYNIEGAIEVQQKEGKAKLLTSPKLLVMNNKEASIDIIEEVPYESTTNNGSQTTISTQFKEVGIRLKVKPLINRDGSIVLTVAPEESYRTAESIGKVPIINTSKSNTTFMLKSGETAVIGGLIRETDSDVEYKVPLLGDIPLLGYLFKRVDKQKVRTELTIFITAKVIQ